MFLTATKIFTLRRYVFTSYRLKEGVSKILLFNTRRSSNIYEHRNPRGLCQFEQDYFNFSNDFVIVFSSVYWLKC